MDLSLITEIIPKAQGLCLPPQTWGTEVRGRGVSWAAQWKADSAVGRAPLCRAGAGRGEGGGTEQAARRGLPQSEPP